MDCPAVELARLGLRSKEQGLGRVGFADEVQHNEQVDGQRRAMAQVTVGAEAKRPQT